MIRIITDTTSDIQVDEARRLGVDLVPLKVIFGEASYLEAFEISMDDFYKRLVSVTELPTTSQPAPADFLPFFEEVKAAGDSAVVLLISGAISGTVQSATIAKDMVGYDQIHIIDSRTTIIGLRLLVEYAVRMREEGLDVETICEELERAKHRVVLLAALDTLDYLYMGGRLSRAGKIAGTLLNFKPVITLRDGALSVVGKGRGVKRAIETIFSTMDDLPEADECTVPIYFGYTATPDKTEILIEEACRRYGFSNTRTHPVGCVVGTHAGPGACVIVYLAKDPVF